MKKLLLLLSVLSLHTAVYANDYDYEVTGLLGGNFAESGYTIKNQFLVGGELQFNDLVMSGIVPELSLLYSFPADYRRVEGASTSVTRAGVNGVYEFEKSGGNTPFLKAGLGYEFLYKKYDGNENGVFVDAGAGIKTDITNDLAFKFEGLYLVKYRNETNYDSNFDNNFLVMAGLTYKFGYNAPVKVVEEPVKVETAPTVVAPVAMVVHKDSDYDGIIDSNDRCPNTLMGVDVNSDGCMLDNDSDGVANTQDKCPNTPSWATVDESGCPVKMTISVSYGFDSALIPDDKIDEVNRFADFLTKELYSVDIVGYADSSGPEAYNLKLSKKRADVFADVLISQGVSSDRISVTGKGEADPIATNKTKEGRAQNRRIEVILLDN